MLSQSSRACRCAAKCRRAAHAVIAAIAVLAAFRGDAAALPHPDPGENTVTVRITEHGIPHIVGKNYRGLGYGFGYAMAKTDLCGLAETFATFNGTRAADFGEAGLDTIGFIGEPIKNVASDQVMRLIIDETQVDEQWRALPKDLQDLVAGYAAGYNFYVASEKPAVPRACRNARWLRQITFRDVLRRVLAFRLAAGLARHHIEIFNAQVPGAAGGLTRHIDGQALLDGQTLSGGLPATVEATQASHGILASLGSNGFAVGRELSENGSGILFGNPHWFWEGPNRLVEAHLTIPGELDVMGVGALGLPAIALGFNRSMAWTHTSSTDAKGTAFRLRLSPNDPTVYLVDGKPIPMSTRVITVLARGAGGKLKRLSHKFWMTRFGPVIESAEFPWTRSFAFTFADPNLGNYRTLQQWFTLAKSYDVEQVRNGLQRILGGAWNNTIAADSKGQVLFADMTVAPGVEVDKYYRCRPEGMQVKQTRGAVFNIMDGSDSSCHWSTYPAAPQAGILPAELRPWLIRTDYVANANYSYWTSNAKQLLTGYSPIIGAEGEPISFRTRTAIVQVEDRLAGRDGLPGNRFTARLIEEIHDSGRDLLAELVVTDLVAACQRNPQAMTDTGHRYDLAKVCAILQRWDRRADTESVGYQVFREFTARIAKGDDTLGRPGLWQVPFDPEDPFHTPRKLNTDTPEILTALASAAEYLDRQGIPLDAPWGQVQFIMRNGKKLPIHGGYQLWDNIVFPLRPHVGYTDLPNYMIGNSYEQAVTFTKDGPIADAVSAGSQAPDDTDSPYYADQTEMYSRKEWMRLPFNSDDIDRKLVTAPILLNVPSDRTARKPR